MLTITPVTINMLIKASTYGVDDTLRVDGGEVHNVSTLPQALTSLVSCLDSLTAANCLQLTFVGKIVSIQSQHTFTVYNIDDGTGRAEVKHWSDQEDNSAETSLHEGTYVRVHGNVRNPGQNRTIVAYSVKPVLDFNEVTFHNLDVIFVHLLNTKGAAVAGANGGGMGAVTPNAKPAAAAGPISGMQTTVNNGLSGRIMVRLVCVLDEAEYYRLGLLTSCCPLGYLQR